MTGNMQIQPPTPTEPKIAGSTVIVLNKDLFFGVTIANTLRALGYARVTSVAGGMARWQAEGLPLAGEAESPRFLDRYARHLLLPEVGLAGQRRLRDAKVALVGAGGLGSPIALSRSNRIRRASSLPAGTAGGATRAARRARAALVDRRRPG